MKHLKSFPIYEKDYEKYNMPDMKQRAETLRDLIKGKLSPEDVINKKDFDYPGWKKKIEELKAFLSPKGFNTAQASEILYPDPNFLPAEARFKKK